MVLVVAFFILLNALRTGATLELDLWWMLTAISSLTEGKSAGEILRFILAPEPPALEPPVVKAFLLLAVPPIGLKIRHLVLISMLVHGANALLLWRVLLQFKLGRRIAFLAACFYFAGLAHFHAFLWPTAFQHLFAVFTLLVLLHFYLKTEERFQAGDSRWKRAYASTLATALLASMQRSALIGGILILADGIVCSRSREERAARYRRWFPLFALSLFYPAWILSSGADGILAGMVLHSGLPDRVKDLFLPAGATHTPIQSALKYPLFFSVGLAALLGLGGFLRWAWRWKKGWKILLFFIAFLIFGGLVLRWFQDKRQLLFPYNALTPFVSTLVSFLWPVQTVFKMGTPEPAHQIIPAQVSLLGAGLSVLLLSFFWSGFVSRKRRLLLFFAWYGLCLVFLLRHPYTAFPVASPSRYFIYLSPGVGVVFSAAAVWGFSKLARALRLKAWVREGILIAFFTALCVSNLAAIRLAGWKGRLANTYYAYDDLRVARLLVEDLRRARPGPPPWTVVVDGVEPMMPMQKIGGMDYPAVDPKRYDNLRIAVREEAAGLIGLLQVNEGTRRPGARHYLLRRSRLLASDGSRVDRFGRALEEGLSRISAGQRREAIGLLERAAEERPFLLNYCLDAGRPLEDVGLLTSGLGFRRWLARIHEGWRTKTGKFEAIHSVMEEELSEYLLCLSTLAELEAQEGRGERSRYWVSQRDLLLEPG